MGWLETTLNGISTQIKNRISRSEAYENFETKKHAEDNYQTKEDAFDPSNNENFLALENAKNTGGIGWAEENDKTFFKWDGSAEEKWLIYSSDSLDVYKMSDSFFTREEIVGAAATYFNSQEVEIKHFVTESDLWDIGQDNNILRCLGTIYSVSTNDAVYKNFEYKKDLTFPTKGVYQTVYKGSSSFYAELSLENTKHTIDNKYLPINGNLTVLQGVVYDLTYTNGNEITTRTGCVNITNLPKGWKNFRDCKEYEPLFLQLRDEYGNNLGCFVGGTIGMFGNSEEKTFYHIGWNSAYNYFTYEQVSFLLKDTAMYSGGTYSVMDKIYYSPNISLDSTYYYQNNLIVTCKQVIDKLANYQNKLTAGENVIIDNDSNTISVSLPTKTSDLENDSGYQTVTQVNTLIDNKLGNIETLLAAI